MCNLTVLFARGKGLLDGIELRQLCVTDIVDSSVIDSVSSAVCGVFT